MFRTSFVIGLRSLLRDKAQAIATVGKIWKNILPGRPMDFYFLDDSFRSLYLSEMRLKSIVTTFTLLAAFISCLGLLGLIAQIAARRTKEIGIRKVLGASMPGVAGLLAKDFLRLVLIANVIAWPIAWYVMNRWLEQFAYHVPIEWWDFVVAGGGAVILTLLTVSVQAIRAARTNPIEALRYE